jgi:phosphatidate cytidylyltransferase
VTDDTADRVNPEGVSPSAMDDLGQRILSAIVLMPLAIGAAIAGGPWLAGAAGAAIVAMTFEWARMSEPKSNNSAWLFGAGAALGGVMFASHLQFLWGLVWVVGIALISAMRRRTLAAAFETVFGALYIGLPCVAFLWLRALPGDGREAIIALFVIVWCADIAAYFAGRTFGGKLLWPAVSPQKTYTGLIAGTAAAAVAGLGCAIGFGQSLLVWASAGAVLGLCGMGGDLLESGIKRRFGVKDASRLIPGHGGVLDRLDSMIAATSAAALALALAPGLANLLWSDP